MGRRIPAVMILLACVSLAAPAASAVRTQTSTVPGLARHGPARRGSMSSWLAELDRALEAVKPEESALAAVLDADKSDEVRESEERLARSRETAALGRSV